MLAVKRDICLSLLSSVPSKSEIYRVLRMSNSPHPDISAVYCILIPLSKPAARFTAAHPPGGDGEKPAPAIALNAAASNGRFAAAYQVKRLAG